jgi:aconitate hydratase 2/2-methylisocitrate dehydratase
VYLASAELAAVAAVLGRLPSVEEYMQFAKDIDSMADDIYKYMNFHQMEEYKQKANSVTIPVANQVTVEA